MSLYKQPGSSVWWLNLSHHGERIRESTGETDREAAQRVHDERKAQLWAVTPALRGRTWGAAVQHWCALQERSDSELLSLAKFGRLYGDRKLIDVTRESIDTALAGFCKTPGTYTRYRTMIAAILNAAKEEGWLREVPKLAQRKPKKQSKTRVWLTPEEWAKLYEQLPGHMRPMAHFSIETGLRQANVLGLTWARVDLARKLVWVEGEDAKGDEAISVPLSIAALNVLRSLQDQHTEFVFTYRGKPIKEVKTAFLAACVRAGVGHYTPGGEYKGFKWHGFRHTWATWHVQNGTPLDVLQKLGGWKDLRMVMKYAHHSPGHLAQFADNATKEKT
jgi:integrase